MIALELVDREMLSRAIADIVEDLDQAMSVLGRRVCGYSTGFTYDVSKTLGARKEEQRYLSNACELARTLWVQIDEVHLHLKLFWVHLPADMIDHHALKDALDKATELSNTVTYTWPLMKGLFVPASLEETHEENLKHFQLAVTACSTLVGLMSMAEGLAKPVEAA